ncbi:dna repair protein rad14 [Ophiostoma piceae UAMH 11346]|uniref:DNA repair protein RAD14 n=1 Tax=Ophiostoma piceae (strain UAMH 11346) TaxID=1262450 RepID=S3C2Z6_OPHP1|nr:dna repair protein rad14 [Ophiostoma piceae UAMH 11346]
MVQSPTQPAGTSGPTPEQLQRTEENRLRAKDLRQQSDATQSPAKGYIASSDVYVVGDKQTSSRNAAAVQASTRNTRASAAGNSRNAVNTPSTTLNSPSKRPHAAISAADMPSNSRNATGSDVEIRPAKNFAKFVDYNFSAMTDTKGGFLSADDEPWRQGGKDGASSGVANDKPAHMTVAEWERLKTIRNLKRLKQGPYEPSLSVLDDQTKVKKCAECGSREIDWVWEEVFQVCVCGDCKNKLPEKYSLLTKTECKEDYLLTEPELKDAELLPHLSRPNPHKTHWHDMMLFLRFQVEEYAINTKWGSAEALDAEFARREADKKRRKEAKFKEKLLQLKKKTRTEAYRRNNAAAGASGAGDRATTFGDAVGSHGRHVHDWGRAIENEAGMSVKRCLSCNMEVEELEF